MSFYCQSNNDGRTFSPIFFQATTVGLCRRHCQNHAWMTLFPARTSQIWIIGMHRSYSGDFAIAAPNPKTTLWLLSVYVMQSNRALFIIIKKKRQSWRRHWNQRLRWIFTIGCHHWLVKKQIVFSNNTTLLIFCSQWLNKNTRTMALTNVLLISQVAGYVATLILSLCVIVPMSLHQDEFK